MRQAALRSLERFLLPNACVACDTVVGSNEPDALVCAVCRSRTRRVPMGCPRCQQPVPPVGPCRFCQDWTPALSNVTSAVWLGPEARAIIHHLKYGNAGSLADVVADIIVKYVAQPSGGWLMPIPIARRRLRDRGYNQAALVARSLGIRWGLPVAEGVLRRTRETKTQTALTPEARVANVAGAFAADRPPKRIGGRAPGLVGVSDVCPSDLPPPRGPTPRARIPVLIDDVMTTGATLDAAAHALAAAGWPQISAMTFARAMPYEIGAAGP
jgi:predicted amidophosphoribosyltransferase